MTTAPTDALPERRDNSLNLVRLVLAALVLVSHAYAITGHTPEPEWHDTTLGTWAVYGFFALSGFLITGSRMTSDMGAYLIRRIARIYPGYLVCLVVTVVVFAPIATSTSTATSGAISPRRTGRPTTSSTT